MNKSKEALKRIETILQPNNIYKQYTDSATMFYKDCDCIRDNLEAYESVILEIIDLLEIEGRGTKQKAKERLMGLLEK